uniref:Uncharacterized protein n=1 Tax=uncultured Caudovirales phage TaxID=2100421 RepID=A0A6J5L0X4_9CAUD|nr:hypothetical protein UFOVP114_26 [uncultured Caudovirales phage]
MNRERFRKLDSEKRMLVRLFEQADAHFDKLHAWQAKHDGSQTARAQEWRTLHEKQEARKRMARGYFYGGDAVLLGKQSGWHPKRKKVPGFVSPPVHVDCKCSILLAGTGEES